MPKPKDIRCIPPQYKNICKIISGKHPAEALDLSNQKCLNKIVRILLYYVRAIELTVLMALNSLDVVQNKPTVGNGKQTIHLINYGASHTDAVIEYKNSDMILHL